MQRAQPVPESASRMDRDVRTTAAFKEAERIFEEIYRPGESFVSDITDLQLSSEPSRLLFTGTLVADLNAPKTTRICEFDLQTGSIELLTFGPNSDHCARCSPDGSTIAFLSDRNGPTDFQLFLLDVRTQAVTAAAGVEGWVEYLAWSPDGRSILLGVAGHGAELSSGQGAFKTGEAAYGDPSWMPQIISALSDSSWRTAWMFDVDSGALSCASGGAGNVWEATWCGNDRLVVIRSDTPEEGGWYSAELALIDIATSATARLYKPLNQIALPKASPSGAHLAFIEAVASDRGFVAGDLQLYSLHDRTCRSLASDNIDVSYIEWRSDTQILAAGHRSLGTVVLLLDMQTNTHKALWESTHTTASGDFATVLGLHHPEHFAFVCESFFQRPRIATVRSGSVHTASVADTNPDWSDDCGDVETVTWQAPDGLTIEGWLLRPRGEPPYATILYIHDGPVFHWRPFWLGREAFTLMLLRRGYAVFLPNMRGSSGRGQAFAAQAIGGIGGADTGDLLSGIDCLVSAGIADGSRLGVTGLSYGGLMTCWLTTQDARFGAAIAVGPATNHVSHHLSCNIPQFVALFLQDHYTNLAGAYYTRSPILQAHRSVTPTLLVCGELDRCTPAEEAIQFQGALSEHGTPAVVVKYPQEGHGVRGIPAGIDFAARCVLWFESHIASPIQHNVGDNHAPGKYC